MNQFIIATNVATVAQRNLITEFLNSKGWSFWHHFEDLWLLTITDNDALTSKQIYEKIKSIPDFGANTYLLVMMVAKQGKEMKHFGFGPAAGWEWTSKNWGSVG
jgi:hypothetical protein